MTVKVQSIPFDPGSVLGNFVSACADPGAVASFVGLCRSRNAGRRVFAMTLEHYPGMTERQLGRLEEEAVRRWALQNCLILHRVGRLEPGDAIVFVAAASDHRKDAFDACTFMMDWLKTEAPFWKQEETADGSVWVEPRESDAESVRRWRRI